MFVLFNRFGLLRHKGEFVSQLMEIEGKEQTILY